MFSKKPRLRGAQAKGMTYERHVYRTLKRWYERGELPGELLYSQWFSFTDANGHGFCQTDILIVTSSFIFILECKLTCTDWAWPQLRELYKPVVERVFKRPAITVQVCKNIYTAPTKGITSIVELMDSPKDGLLTWHFLP